MKNKKNVIENIDDIFIDTSRLSNENQILKNIDTINTTFINPFDLDLNEDENEEIDNNRINSLNFKSPQTTPKIIKDIIIEREDILNKKESIFETIDDSEMLKNKMLNHGLKKQVKDKRIDIKIINKDDIDIDEDNINTDIKKNNSIKNLKKKEILPKVHTLVDRDVANINKMIEEKRKFEEEQKNKKNQVKKPEKLIKNMSTKILPSQEEYEKMKKDVIYEQKIQLKKENNFNNLKDKINVNNNQKEIDNLLDKNTIQHKTISETKKSKNILNKNENFSDEINKGIKKIKEEDDLKPLNVYIEETDTEFNSLYNEDEEKAPSKIFILGMTVFAIVIVSVIVFMVFTM